MQQFNTPAYQGPVDVQSLPQEQQDAFLTSWSNYVKYCTLTSQMGNPWSSTFDHPRAWYFNWLDNPVQPSADNTVPILWTAFPNRIIHYFTDQFNQVFGSDATDKLHELADIGPTAFQQKYNIVLVVPQQPCIPDSTGTKAFGPAGPRGWQDEYCEWAVTRNENGDIIAVDFTHENPEYWFHLWRISPDTVLSLYKQVLNNDNVALEDLYLYDEQGQPVIVRETGLPAYNPINKWNNGTVATATGGGAVHLTSPPNSLGAEIYLGAAATILRTDALGNVITNANELICAAQYGQIFRNSDPNIGFNVNQLVLKYNLQIALTNPIALYGQVPQNWAAFTMPAGANKTIQDCYEIVRGVESLDPSIGYYPHNMVLHSRFFVPQGANFTLSDIMVNGVPLKWGSQIADVFQVQLAGTGIPGTGSPQKFPKVGDPVTELPSVQYLLDFNLLSASLYNQLETLSNLTSCITQVEAGTTTGNIAVLTSSAEKTTQFNFGDGISYEVESFQDLGDMGQLFVLSITVSASCALGEKPLSLFNNSTDPQYPAYGVLEVVPAGTLAAPSTASNKEFSLTPAQLSHLKSIL